MNSETPDFKLVALIARPVCPIYKLELLLNLLDEQYFLPCCVYVVFVNESSFKLRAKNKNKNKRIVVVKYDR